LTEPDSKRFFIQDLRQSSQNFAIADIADVINFIKGSQHFFQREQTSKMTSYTKICFTLLAFLEVASQLCQGFAVHFQQSSVSLSGIGTKTCLFASAPDGDSAADEEGADLAAQFFQMAQAKGVQLDAEDLMDDEDDEDEEEDEPEPNIPQGAINAFLGYDTGDVGEKLAGNVSLTDDQLYSEVKERVLDTAGGFVDLVGGAREDDDDDLDDDTPKPYQAPTQIPDSDLTAGEVVLLLLEVLKNNDNPTQNKGVEILFGYSAASSAIMNEDGLTPEEYAEFLKEAEYKVLFDHQEVVSN
jgi:hypothetical protein